MSRLTFKERLSGGETLVGTFLKTPSSIVTEILSMTELDCLCLDAEHAPFTRSSLDSCTQVARAAKMDVLVRVPSAAPEHLLQALDSGATGVLVPHVRSVAEAEAIVRAAHFGPGGRGYAGSTRAAGYTTLSIAEHRRDSALRTVVIAQIEDPEAVEQVEAIAGVAGLDALFVGRVDLTVAYGAESQDDPSVLAAVERICAAGRNSGKPVGMFLARVDDVRYWRGQGASFFLLGSDHTFLLAGAGDLLHRVKANT